MGMLDGQGGLLGHCICSAPHMQVTYASAHERSRYSPYQLSGYRIAKGDFAQPSPQAACPDLSVVAVIVLLVSTPMRVLLVSTPVRVLLVSAPGSSLMVSPVPMRRSVCTVIVATNKVAMIGFVAAAAVVAASAVSDKPMAAPTVGIAPTGPGPNAQEDAVVKISGPIEAVGRAGIGWRFVIAKLAYGRHTNVNADGDLRLSRWRQRHAGKQCCTTEQNLESLHVSPIVELSAV